MQENSSSVNQFRLTVYIEDQVSQKGPFQIIVHKPWKLKLSQLKQRAQALWNIPVSLQYWILNGSVPGNDDSTISELCSESSAIAFLCIVAPHPDGPSSRRHSAAESLSPAAPSARQPRQKKVSRSSTCSLPNTSATESTRPRQLTINDLAIKINQALLQLNALKTTTLSSAPQVKDEQAANNVPENANPERKISGATVAPLVLSKTVTNQQSVHRAEDFLKPDDVVLLNTNKVGNEGARKGIVQVEKTGVGVEDKFPEGIIDLQPVATTPYCPAETSIQDEANLNPAEASEVSQNIVEVDLDLTKQEGDPDQEQIPEKQVLLVSSLIEANDPTIVDITESVADANLDEAVIDEKCASEQISRTCPSLVLPGDVQAEAEVVAEAVEVKAVDSDTDTAAAETSDVKVDHPELQEELPNNAHIDQRANSSIQNRPQVSFQIEEALLPSEESINITTTTVAQEQMYRNLMEMAENVGAIRNQEAFECKICFSNTEVGQGIVLKNCLHMFCRNCIEDVVNFSTEAQIHCPYIDENYSCESYIQEEEIRDVVGIELFEKYLGRSIKLAELTSANAFHCKTSDCKGWCIIEGNVRIFTCPICSTQNCISCQAIHTGESCEEYQTRQEEEFAEKNAQEATSVKFLKDMIKRGEALDCPNCHVVLLRKWGCDWLRCSYCKTEICWVTKGFRWGPNGKGDTSGGCRCGINGVKCHPKCTYCH